MFKRVFLALFLLTGTLVVRVPEAHAQNVQTLDRILPEIRRSTPGTMSDAEGPIAGPDGQARYRIKWLTPDGRIIWLEVDARTGRILSQTNGGNQPQRGGRSNFRDDEENGLSIPVFIRPLGQIRPGTLLGK